MKKHAIRALLILCLCLFTGLAAEAATLTVKNNTGVTIEELYLSDSGTDNWEEDVLGRDVLEDGESLRIDIDGSYGLFDLMIVTEAGETVTFTQVSGKVKSMTLHNDGTADVN